MEKNLNFGTHVFINFLYRNNFGDQNLDVIRQTQPWLPKKMCVKHFFLPKKTQKDLVCQGVVLLVVCHCGILTSCGRQMIPGRMLQKFQCTKCKIKNNNFLTCLSNFFRTLIPEIFFSRPTKKNLPECFHQFHKTLKVGEHGIFAKKKQHHKHKNIKAFKTGLLKTNSNEWSLTVRKSFFSVFFWPPPYDWRECQKKIAILKNLSFSSLKTSSNIFVQKIKQTVLNLGRNNFFSIFTQEKKWKEKSMFPLNVFHPLFT